MRIYMNGEQFNQIMTMAKNVASVDDSRPVLCGVHIVCNDKGECKAEALDGFKAGIYSWNCTLPDFVPGECIIPVQPPRKYGKSGCPYVEIKKENNLVTIFDSFGLTTVKTIDGEYINLDRVYPKNEAAQTVFVNVAYLEAVLKAVKSNAKASSNNMVKIEMRGLHAPVRIATADCNMLVLPVRANTGDKW